MKPGAGAVVVLVAVAVGSLLRSEAEAPKTLEQRVADFETASQALPD